MPWVPSSRTLNHRSVRGEPTPTLQAEYDELVGMASALGTSGRGVMEMISDFDDLDAEFSLLESMVRCRTPHVYFPSSGHQ